MAGTISQHVIYGYMISDGLHVVKASRKHWAELKARGATEAELKQLEATIAEAKRLVAVQKTGQTPLELARLDLKDRLGDFRASGRSVVVTIAGVDEVSEKDLQMKGSFPSTDLAISNYFDAIAPNLPAYSDKLAKRGFSKKAQDELLVSGASFKSAFLARGLERGEAQAATLVREAAFKKLQTEITYFRTLGHEALRKSQDRKDFDRVKVKKAPKPEVAAAKRAARVAKKQAKEQKKKDAKAKKAAKKPTGT